MEAVTYESVGLELHALIARLEPARWTEDVRPELTRRFEALRDELSALAADSRMTTAFESAASRLPDLEAALAALPAEDDLRERWMEFRLTIHPQYEAFAVALRACHVQLPSLRPTNYIRSLVHVFFGVVAVAFVELIPWRFAEMTIFSITGIAWFFEVSRRYSERWNDVLMWAFGPIAHPHERYHVNSSTWYATALTLLAFTGSQTACVAAVAALGFGDPAAALIGRRFGRTKLVNNRSLEGTLGFAVVAFAAILGIMATWHHDLWPGGALAVAAVAGVAGALAELFSRRVDDNFSIPLVAGAATYATLLIIG